jgi:hypothetical protein
LEKDNHEFSPFLQKLHRDNPNVPIHIVLIDPLLEHHPYVVCNNVNKSEDWNINTLLNHGRYTSTCDSDVYLNDASSMSIYCVRNIVSYDDDHSGTAFKIVEWFTKLNTLVKEKSYFLAVNDFSGNSLYSYSEKNKLLIGDSLNHIIYGIGACGDYGCHVDLSNPVCLFAQIPNGNGTKVFNPYLFEQCIYNTKPIICELSCYTSSKINIDCMVMQTKCMISNMLRTMLLHICALRKSFLLLKDESIMMEHHCMRYI